jgi:hypothetical protein
VIDRTYWQTCAALHVPEAQSAFDAQPTPAAQSPPCPPDIPDTMNDGMVSVIGALPSEVARRFTSDTVAPFAVAVTSIKALIGAEIRLAMAAAESVGAYTMPTWPAPAVVCVSSNTRLFVPSFSVNVSPVTSCGAGTATIAPVAADSVTLEQVALHEPQAEVLPSSHTSPATALM